MDLYSLLIRQLPAFTPPCRIYNLTGSSSALLLALQTHSFVAVEKDEETAEVLKRDIDFYRSIFSGGHVVLLPDMNGPESSGVRSKALYDLNPGDSIVTSLSGIQSFFWDKEALDRNIVHISTGQHINRTDLEDSLVQLGYRKVPMVAGKCEYSRREWLIDLFPSTAAYPLRLEFFGDEIERCRTFDIETQRSKSDVSDFKIFPAREPDEPGGLDGYAAERKYFCLFNPRNREGLPGDTTFLSRYSFVADEQPEDEDIDQGREVLSQIDAGIFSLKGLGILAEERKGIGLLAERMSSLALTNRIILVAPSTGQADRLRELFREKEIILPAVAASDISGFEGNISVTVGRISSGLFLKGLMILTERELFGERHSFRPIKKSAVANLLSSIDDIVPGDFVVHQEHGIGKFTGVVRRPSESTELELMQLEYEDGRLYIPIQNIQSLSKYRSEEGSAPRIDRLGGKTWQKKKERARKRIHELAEKLLTLYAGRKLVRGFNFSSDTELHREFDSFFPYEETPDQLTAIRDIKKDMESERPMDRLLCGDVGYGKTEVAMRAAFKAVYDSRQVAVLVPTTILAEQHYRTFRERFSGFPVGIDFISRFKSRREINATLKASEKGEIDILIGTHGLLSRKVLFNRLGLLIVDEEHKFGVGQKERIKEISRDVDVLNMTATPIPRTLHMALSGIRDISVIETPPEERLVVKTVVARSSDGLIKDALSRELDRGGQAFFVHNRVHDIFKYGRHLQELLPAAKIAVAHGQMPEKELEDVMHSFFEGNVDILVSTSIIGSGLDITRANTIMVNRADKMGLADLYQLRGRVGRGNLKGYAFFLVPGESLMTDEAKKRIQAIQEMSYLGAGFRLALKDLEIRGAGNIFGPEQSGHINEIGFDLYIEMLERAVAELKGIDIKEEKETVIDLKISAFIPEEYVSDVMLRMSFYRRISSLKTEKDIEDFGDELKDRFGIFPDEVLNLLDIMRLKTSGRDLSVVRIQGVNGKVRIIFSSDTPVHPDQIFALHKTRKGKIKFLPDGFELDLKGLKWQRAFEQIYGAMKELKDSVHAT